MGIFTQYFGYKDLLFPGQGDSRVRPRVGAADHRPHGALHAAQAGEDLSHRLTELRRPTSQVTEHF